jgi:DNA-binding FadR family transcriptional regulator
MQLDKLDSSFLRYLIETEAVPGERVPSLSEISDELGISIGKLREQLEVARNLGLVSVRPRLGIQREAFDFSQSIINGLLFSLAMGEGTFEQYSQLRQVVEAGFWNQAAVELTEDDKIELHELVGNAWDKLRGEPVHVPNSEHRNFHLTIFKRLDNPYVLGVLEAYWDAYEASEFTRFASYAYWVEVWTYHERIAEALCNNDFELGRQLLVEHFSLLRTVPAASAELDPTGTESQLSSEGAIR